MLSRTAPQILLDASPLCRFAECQLLSEMRTYLGERAHITREVERELLRLSAKPRFEQLTGHLVAEGAVARVQGKWPKRTKPLPDSLKPQFATLLALKRAVGEHERAHAGEIATVLMATHRRADLVIIDDDWGSDLAAKRYGLTVMSTARLALEMVLASALSEDDGFQVFDSATPAGVGRERFESVLGRLRR